MQFEKLQTRLSRVEGSLDKMLTVDIEIERSGLRVYNTKIPSSGEK